MASDEVEGSAGTPKAAGAADAVQVRLEGRPPLVLLHRHVVVHHQRHLPPPQGACLELAAVQMAGPERAPRHTWCDLTLGAARVWYRESMVKLSAWRIALISIKGAG